MAYENRNKVRDSIKEKVSEIMQHFPKDYSDVVLGMIKRDISSYMYELQKESVNAFCEDNDICPICITGGWRCDSDHK